MSHSTLAPSEKHLEDWIVANCQFVGDSGEYDEEDWLDDCPHLPDGSIITTGLDRVIARQLTLPSGICDLIALATNFYYNPTLAVVELKKGVIDTLAFTQCLRYMRDLNEIFFYTMVERDLYKSYRPMSKFDFSLGATPEISGILIGHSVQDNNLLIACEAAGIQVYTYEYRDGFYFFQSQWVNAVDGLIEIHRDFSRGALGDAMEEIIRLNLNSRVNKGWVTK